MNGLIKVMKYEGQPGQMSKLDVNERRLRSSLKLKE
jgi:hypothetical protein